MRLLVGNVTELDIGDEGLRSVVVTSPENTKQRLALDHLLIFFGLSPKLGPIAQWGVELEKKKIPVNTECFQTKVEGLFAIGDISTYPGKKKLILSGFHEATLAAFAIKKHLYPDEKVTVQYTTTSSLLQERLNVERHETERIEVRPTG